jgi:transposase
MPRGRIEANAEVWRERVERWKQSGLTAKEFSEREGIARPGSLSWWQYYLKRRPKKGVPADQPPLKLVRLEPVRARRAREPKRPSSITIQCGEHRVVVASDFDDVLLRRVLSILEAPR